LDYEVTHEFLAIGTRIFLLTARRLSRTDNNSTQIFLDFTDVTKSRAKEREAMLQFVATRLHGMLDYLVSALVIALPILVGWHGARWTFVALGCLGIIYCLLTDYERGAVLLLPMTLHLVLDAVSGIAMVGHSCGRSICLAPPGSAWRSACWR
jgi:hypothetical protein